MSERDCKYSRNSFHWDGKIRLLINVPKLLLFISNTFVGAFPFHSFIIVFKKINTNNKDTKLDEIKVTEIDKTRKRLENHYKGFSRRRNKAV